jgi:asparaginyl-tRNA synthetase
MTSHVLGKNTISLVKYQQQYIDINKIDTTLLNETIVVNGWVRNKRIQANLAFVEVFDGSTSKTIQVTTENKEFIEQLNTLSIGSSISVVGLVVLTPDESKVELRLESIEYMGLVEDPLTYILNAKKTSLDILRDHQDVRVKTRTFNAVFRIRAGLSKATHDFFHMIGAKHLNPNIITTSDCEGAGEVFTLTNMLHKTNNLPIIKDTNQIDYSKDFFEKQAFLTVSSQLQLELLCAGLSKVWTSNKSFRSEKSKTTRHLAEFEHIEWEFAWIGLGDLMDLSEHYTQYCFQNILNNHIDDLEELNKFTSKGIIDKLKSFCSKPYIRISYDDAIKLIQDNQKEILEKSNLNSLPKWGDDLGSECEKYISEVIYNHPVFVYNYPKDLKSFYMKQNTDGRTVQGCDLLVPGLGELIGSSVREHDYQKLIKVVEERKMDITPLKWYMDLRKNGSTPTAGAGLGFDRLVRICTGIDNIRDAVCFPVAYGECKF